MATYQDVPVQGHLSLDLLAAATAFALVSNLVGIAFAQSGRRARGRCFLDFLGLLRVGGDPRVLGGFGDRHRSVPHHCLTLDGFWEETGNLTGFTILVRLVLLLARQLTMFASSQISCYHDERETRLTCSLERGPTFRNPFASWERGGIGYCSMVNHLSRDLGKAYISCFTPVFGAADKSTLAMNSSNCSFAKRSAASARSDTGAKEVLSKSSSLLLVRKQKDLGRV
jgi:hypothetical protein